MSPDIPVIRYEQSRAFAEIADHLRYAEVGDWCEETLKSHLVNLDPKQCHYFGEDFGRTGDLTVIIPLAEQQNATFRAPFVLELRNMPFQQQEQICLSGRPPAALLRRRIGCPGKRAISGRAGDAAIRPPENCPDYADGKLVSGNHAEI